ncbi:MAG TPA: hypothetical protein VL995_21100 [Cellvibrio sp.]|nr:hypothetical protein [Cellvibrio sp.]
MALTKEDMTQITDLIRAENKQLREEINRVDDWANGLYAALNDVVSEVGRLDPEIAARLATKWSKVAKQFDQQEAEPHLNFEESLEQLEARKILYRTLVITGDLPTVDH